MDFVECELGVLAIYKVVFICIRIRGTERGCFIYLV